MVEIVLLYVFQLWYFSLRLYHCSLGLPALRAVTTLFRRHASRCSCHLSRGSSWSLEEGPRRWCLPLAGVLFLFSYMYGDRVGGGYDACSVPGSGPRVTSSCLTLTLRQRRQTSDVCHLRLLGFFAEKCKATMAVQYVVSPSQPTIINMYS